MGFKQDVKAIADIAHRKGSLVLVDAYQLPGSGAAGRESHEHRHSRIRAAWKYLFGIPGVAFMYVNKPDHTGTEAFCDRMVRPTNPFLFQTRYLDWAIQDEPV